MFVERPDGIEEESAVLLKKPISHRNFWKYLLLSFITCGIYGIYIFWGLVKDINEVCKEDGKTSPNYIIVLLLSYATCGIYGLYWWYTQGERVYNASARYGVTVREKGSTILLWQILGRTLMPGVGMLAATYIMFDNMNRIAFVHNGEISKEEIQTLKKPHPHLVRNVLSIYGILFMALIVLLAMVPVEEETVKEQTVVEKKTEVKEKQKKKTSKKDTSKKDVPKADFSKMDFSELIGKPEKDLKNIGLKESKQDSGYEALDGSIQVNCTNGNVTSIKLKGDSKKMPSFHNVKIGMSKKKARQNLLEIYPEEMKETSKISFMNLDTRGSVTCKIADGKVSTIEYKELSEDAVKKLKEEKKKSEEEKLKKEEEKKEKKQVAEKKKTVEITGDMMQDAQNGALYVGTDGVIVDADGKPIPQYADYYVTADGIVTNGSYIVEGFAVSADGKKIVVQLPGEVETKTPGETALDLEKSVESYDARDAVRNAFETDGLRIQIRGSINEWEGEFYVPIGDNVSAIRLDDCKIFNEDGMETKLIGGDYVHVIGVFHASYTTDDFGYRYYSMSDCYVIIQDSLF